MLLPLSTAGMEDMLPSQEEVAALEAGMEVDEDETVAAQAALEQEAAQAEEIKLDANGQIITPATSLEVVRQLWNRRTGRTCTGTTAPLAVPTKAVDLLLRAACLLKTPPQGAWHDHLYEK